MRLILKKKLIFQNIELFHFNQIDHIKMIAVEVEYDYEAELQDELTIHAGDILTSVKQMSGGWWEGVLKGKRGLFPENFVKVLFYI